MASYQLLLLECGGGVCVRACDFVHVSGGLCMLVNAGACLQGFLMTYILLSMINSQEICVNQLPLWPAGRPACLHAAAAASRVTEEISRPH